MNTSLNDLPFDVNSLIPYNQFNWDCVDGLDCIYKDIQGVYSDVTSRIGKGLAAVDEIVNGILEVLHRHYAGAINTANDMQMIVMKEIEQKVRDGLASVLIAPEVSPEYRQPYIVYREDECGRYYPRVELWPSPPKEVEFYGPYKNQAILRIVATRVLPIKHVGDVVIGGDSGYVSSVNSAYLNHDPIDVNGTTYYPDSPLTDDSLNAEWNRLYQATLPLCRVIDDDSGFVPPPINRVVVDDTGFVPPGNTSVQPPAYTVVGDDDELILSISEWRQTYFYNEYPPDNVAIWLDDGNRRFVSLYNLQNAILRNCNNDAVRTRYPHWFNQREVPGYISPENLAIFPNTHIQGIPLTTCTNTPSPIDNPVYNPPPVSPRPGTPEVKPPNTNVQIVNQPCDNTACCDAIVNALTTIADRLGGGDKKDVSIDEGDIDISGSPDAKYEMSEQFVSDYNSMLITNGLASRVDTSFSTLEEMVQEYLLIASEKLTT